MKLNRLHRCFRHRLALAALLVLCLGVPARAHLITLVDGNSTADFDVHSPLGLFEWLVDGVDHMGQQWFWYRVGANPEQSIDTLNLLNHLAIDTTGDNNLDNLFVTLLDPNGQFTIDVNYRLFGGVPGSGASDIAEQIRITNLTGAVLDFHFFQYSDFDLLDTPLGDTVTFLTPTSVSQSETVGPTQFAINETVVLPTPSHREGDFFNNTITKLNDGVADNLNDTALLAPVGPGDVTWAYQWDVAIGANKSFLISKDKQITSAVIPEPSSVALLAVGAAGAIFLARRRRRRG